MISQIFRKKWEGKIRNANKFFKRGSSFNGMKMWRKEECKINYNLQTRKYCALISCSYVIIGYKGRVGYPALPNFSATQFQIQGKLRNSKSSFMVSKISKLLKKLLSPPNPPSPSPLNIHHKKQFLKHFVNFCRVFHSLVFMNIR